MLVSFPVRATVRRRVAIRRPITGHPPLCPVCPESRVPPLSGWTGTRKHPVDVSKFYLFVVRVVLQHFRAIKIVQWPGPGRSFLPAHFAWARKLG